MTSEGIKVIRSNDAMRKLAKWRDKKERFILQSGIIIGLSHIYKVTCEIPLKKEVRGDCQGDI